MMYQIKKPSIQWNLGFMNYFNKEIKIKVLYIFTLVIAIAANKCDLIDHNYYNKS